VLLDRRRRADVALDAVALNGAVEVVFGVHRLYRGNARQRREDLIGRLVLVEVNDVRPFRYGLHLGEADDLNAGLGRAVRDLATGVGHDRNVMSRFHQSSRQLEHVEFAPAGSAEGERYEQHPHPVSTSDSDPPALAARPLTLGPHPGHDRVRARTRR